MTGNTARYADFDGSPYSVSGVTQKGNQIGRTIGFPTLNLVPEASLLLPSNGVYVSMCLAEDGNFYPGVTNVGNRPTVEGTMTTVETHLLQCPDWLTYGHEIRVWLFEKLREEKRYASLEALKEQIFSDRRQAASYHEKKDYAALCRM